MGKPCGCRIVYIDTLAIFPKNDRIEYCPLHGAAAKMQCALSDAEAWIGEGLEQFAAKDAKGALLGHMREALAAASGQEQGE